MVTVAAKIRAAKGAINGIMSEKNREKPKKVTAIQPLNEMS